MADSICWAVGTAKAAPDTSISDANRAARNFFMCRTGRIAVRLHVSRFSGVTRGAPKSAGAASRPVDYFTASCEATSTVALLRRRVQLLLQRFETVVDGRAAVQVGELVVE